MIHTCHQRTFNNIYSLGIFLQGFCQVFFQIIAYSFSQSIFQPLFYRSTFPPRLLRTSYSLHNPICSSCFSCISLGLQTFGRLNQPLGSIRPTIQHHVLNTLQYIGRNVGIEHRSSRIDNTHIHPLANGMIQEHSMHRLADIIVSPKRERKIADSTTDVGAR